MANLKASLAQLVMAWLLVALIHPVTRAQETPTEPIAAIAARIEDKKVVDTVETLGITITRRELGPDITGVQVLVKAREMPERIVLWVDSDSSSITVLRTEDGMLLSRLIARKAFSETPYVAALAATELLELMRTTPAPRVEAPKPTVADAPPIRVRRTWEVLASAGADLAAGPRHGPAMFRPSLSADLLYRLSSSSMFADLGMVALPYGVTVEPLPRSDEGSVQYRRTDLALRLGFGVQRADTSVLAHVSPGLGLLSAQAQGIDDERERTRHRTQVVLGGGILFRQFVWDRFGIAFGMEVTWLTSPARYLADGQLVLEEDALRIGASLALLVRLY